MCRSRPIQGATGNLAGSIQEGRLKIAVDTSGQDAERMLARQCRHEASQVSYRMGAISVAASGPVIRKASDTELLAIIGTPVGHLDSKRIVDATSAADILSNLDGAFAAIYWSGTERKLVVVTDFLGYKPLYLRRTERGIQIAGETKAWVADPDPAGWGAFISFGHTIGNRTLLQGVHRVAPASVLVYAADTGQVTERSYWRWPEPADTPDLGALVEALSSSVRL